MTSVKSYKELKRLAKERIDGTPVENDVRKAITEPEIKAALIGDTATQFLATAILGAGVEHNLNIRLYEAGYNQVEQQVENPTSELFAFAPEYIIVFQSTHKLLQKYNCYEQEQRRGLAEERIAFVEKVCATFPNSRIIYYNYPETDDRVWGSYGNRIEESFIYQLRKLNFELMNLAQRFGNLFICDVVSIQNTVGRQRILHSSQYVSADMVLSMEAVPIVAERTIDIISACVGRIHKCLILDLDNTLWGGVIGDDGMENIQIGHGLGIGKAFTEFQLWLRKLRQRGVILCVCSKNDESVAKAPFEKHPDMVLRPEDITLFVANWNNKSDNIRYIQSVLHIGFDAMVFLDDNPFERNMVRENLPEVCVPELPEDPAEYLEFLYAENLFETASYSEEDSLRTQQYRTEAKRTAERLQFTNEAEYLESLRMVSKVESLTPFNIPRVVQLSQRSNQFNLRTIRYTADEAERMAHDQNLRCLTFTLQDKFGDNGLVCVVVMREQDKHTLFIESWFMSCRVLQRGMENFVLNRMAEQAQQSGYDRIEGEYIPTAKNGMVKDLYAQLGFAATDRENHFVLDIRRYTPQECFISKQ